jgi:hypothetical protein
MVDRDETIPRQTEDDEDFRDLTHGRYTVMPVSEPKKARKGTIDRLEEMPHRKRARAARTPRTTTGWKRSARGNLCRLFKNRYRGVVIRPNESSRKQEFSWLIGDNSTDLGEFSERKYATEDEAFSALVDELEARGIC